MKTIDELVYGHSQAKKVLSVLLKRSKDRYFKKCVLGLDEYPESLKCLLIGPSGTGKTHLIQSFKKLNDFPFISIDATSLQPSGNSEGTNVKQLIKLINDTAKTCLNNSKDNNDGRYNSIEGVINQMVIFVDEFDKLGTSFESTGNWNKHVQANFLTVIDNKEEFAGISWVLAGAFSGLYEAKPNSIGFNKVDADKETKEITDKDILKSGIIPEMLGRISLIVQLDDFTEEDYRTVLVNKLLPSYTNLEPSDDEISKIVKKAHTSGQGIRSITRQLEMMSIDVEFEECLQPKW